MTPNAGDTVVRQEAVEVVTRIAEKVQARAHEATHTPANVDDEVRRRLEVEGALKYAVDALRGVVTALDLGRGGYVGWDAETSLYFRGVLEGAVIDRDTTFSAHT